MPIYHYGFNKRVVDNNIKHLSLLKMKINEQECDINERKEYMQETQCTQQATTVNLLNV